MPLLVLTGDTDLSQRFADAAKTNRDRTTHYHIFPTLLQLLAFDAEAVRARYGPGLLDPIPPAVRRFSYGPIVSYRGRTKTWREVPSDVREKLGMPSL